MIKTRSVLEKVSSSIYALEKWILIISIVVMVSINFIQVVSRYLFKSSFPWCEQLSVVLFMLMILLGGNIAIKTDSEIKIEVIKFKNKKKDQIYRLFSDIIGIFTIVCLLIGSVNLVKQSMVYSQALATLPLKYYHLYLLLVIGFSLMLLDKVIYFLKRIESIISPVENEVIE